MFLFDFMQCFGKPPALFVALSWMEKSHFVWLIVNSLRLIIRAKDEEWCLYELHSFNSSHLVQ